MARIDRMRKVNEHVDQLKKAMKEEVREKLKNDQAAYKTLMKDLLIQVSVIIRFLTILFVLGTYQIDGGANFH